MVYTGNKHDDSCISTVRKNKLCCLPRISATCVIGQGVSWTTIIVGGTHRFLSDLCCVCYVRYIGSMQTYFTSAKLVAAPARYSCTYIPQVKQCVGDVVASFHQAGNDFGPLRLGIVTYADFTTAEDYYPKVCWQVFPVVQRFCGRPCEGGREGGRGSAPLTQAFRRISKPQFSRRHLSADDLLQSIIIELSRGANLSKSEAAWAVNRGELDSPIDNREKLRSRSLYP